MKYSIISLALLFFLASIYFIPKIKQKSSAIQESKEDLAEINKINYGLFNLDHWKKEILVVFENKIQEFEISPNAYKEVTKELEKYLKGINSKYIESGKIFEPIFAEAEKSGSINKGFLKLLKENTVPQVKQLNIPKFIPSLSISLANELKKQEPRLRDIMRNELVKMLKYEPETINDPRNLIYKKYNQFDRNSTTSYLTSHIDLLTIELDKHIKYQYICIAVSIVFGLLALFLISVPWSVVLLSISAITLLYLGVTLPMINLEALLNAFTMDVLGTPLSFDKQYLYYQSKSILQVTSTLIKSHGLDTKVVGYLVFCFSIVFPFMKMTITMVNVILYRTRTSRWMEYFIFNLGKWSMADVFVVAIFMSYIGFYGILTSQLASIAENRNGFAIETINNSSLAPGALYFTSYCVLSIFISIIIHRARIQKPIVP